MPEKQLPHHHFQSEEAAKLSERLGHTQEFEVVCEIFKQLSDTSRIRIFWLLCHYEECVINISALMDMSSPAVSHHLKLLRAGNLITSRRDGKEVYYRSVQTPASRILHDSMEQLMAITCPMKNPE